MKLSHLSKILGTSAIAASVTLLSSSAPVLAQYEEGAVNEYPSESSESVQPTSPEYDPTVEQNLDRAAEEARDSIEATGAAASESLESAGQAVQQNADSAVRQIESATDEAQRNIEATSQQAQQQMAQTAEELEERANWGWLGLLGLLGLFGLVGRKKERHHDTEVRYETDRHSQPFPHQTETTRTATTTNSNRTL